MIMNTQNLLFGAAVAAALVLNQNAGAGIFSAADLNNRAVAASPRAQEEFPGLTRPVASIWATPVANNLAYASSPRERELHPELAVGKSFHTAAAVEAGASDNGLDRVSENRALAASPRMKERFPILARGTVETGVAAFKVAPIK